MAKKKRSAKQIAAFRRMQAGLARWRRGQGGGKKASQPKSAKGGTLAGKKKAPAQSSAGGKKKTTTRRRQQDLFDVKKITARKNIELVGGVAGGFIAGNVAVEQIGKVEQVPKSLKEGPGILATKAAVALGVPMIFKGRLGRAISLGVAASGLLDAYSLIRASMAKKEAGKTGLGADRRGIVSTRQLEEMLSN